MGGFRGVSDAGRLAERRRMAMAVVGQGSPAAARVSSAPEAFIRQLSTSDIARCAKLIDPPPRGTKIELGIVPAGRMGRWYVDVAGRDRPRMLVGITGALADAGYDVDTAVVATWPDGTVLDAFVVAASQPPVSAVLSGAIARWLLKPLQVAQLKDARVTFSPGQRSTICDVRAKDRPGLLHTLASAFASAGAEIQTARVTTVGGHAVDQFELTSRRHDALDEPTQSAIKNVLAFGTTTAQRA